MSPSGRARTPWVEAVASTIATNRSRGTIFLVMHEYRPPLVRALADEVGYRFLDFRTERMQPLGWAAGRLPLGSIAEAIMEALGRDLTGARGLVVHNVEALLAAKPAAERQAWLADVEARDWPVPVVLAMAIFQADLPRPTSRLHRVDPDDIPAETLLSRLATQ